MPEGPVEWQAKRSKCALQQCGSVRCCAVVAVVCALCLFVMAVFLPVVFDWVLSVEIRKSLMLDAPSAPGLADFRSNAGSNDTLLLKLYVHSIENVEDVELRKARPRLATVGPFVYRVIIENHNLTWMQDHEVIATKEWQKFVPIPALSASDATKTYINTLNFPMLFAYHSFVARLPIELRAAAMGIAYCGASTSRMIVNRTVHDLIFGYQDDRLHGANAAREALVANGLQADPFAAAFVRTLGGTTVNFPGLLPNMTTRADFEERGETYALHTGKYMPHLMHGVVSYEGNDHVQLCLPLRRGRSRLCEPLWSAPWANAVGGSDGAYFNPSDVAHRRPLTLWMRVFKTRVALEPGTRVQVDNIDTVRYRLSRGVLLNATENPRNAAYGMWGPTGLFNASRLARGFPLSVSAPNFYQGDPALRDAVDGLLPPDPARDAPVDAFLHAWTGIPIRFVQRLQFNAHIGPLRDVNLLAHVRPTVLPIFRAEFHEALSRTHKNMFATCDEAKDAVEAIHLASYVVGGLAILVGLGAGCVHMERSKRIELRKRRSGLYQALMLEAGDLTEHYINTWIDRAHALRHPHLRTGMTVTFVVGFIINMAVELYLTRKLPHLGVLVPHEQGQRTALISMAPDSFVNAFLSALGALREAKYAVEMGFFPTVYWPALRKPSVSWRKQAWRDGAIFLLGPARYCSRMLFVAVVAGVWMWLLFGAPAILALVALRYVFGVHTLPSKLFSLFKSFYLSVQTVAVFYALYLHMASSDAAPLYEFLDHHDPLLESQARRAANGEQDRVRNCRDDDDDDDAVLGGLFTDLTSQSALATP